MGIVRKHGSIFPNFSTKGGSFSEIEITNLGGVCISDLSYNYADGGIPLTHNILSPETYNKNGKLHAFASTKGDLSRKSGIYCGNHSVNDDFDFRWRFSQMDVPNGYSDSTFALISGVLYGNDYMADGGRYYVTIDSPAVNRRRMKVIFGRYYEPSEDQILFQATETSFGEFGPAVIHENSIQGLVIRNLRMYRVGSKLGIEWNYASEITVEDEGFDKLWPTTNVFKHKFETSLRSGLYILHPEAGLFGDDVGVLMQSYVRVNKPLVSADFTGMMEISAFESVPAICIDTTSENCAVDILSYDDNSIRFLSKSRGEGIANLRVTQWNSDGNTSVYGNRIEFLRKEPTCEFPTSFLYDNILEGPYTNDHLDNIYMDNIDRSTNGMSNIQPSMMCDGPIVVDDKIYKLEITKGGQFDEVVSEDSTNINIGVVIDPYLLKSKSSFGSNNLPQYTFNDGTHTLGRDAKFRIMDNIILDLDPSETHVLDNYKLCERDATSYYIIETVSDGTNFLVYSRVYNFYDKSVGARVRVNTETSYVVSPETYTTNPNTSSRTFKYVKPNPIILTFTDKHICSMRISTGATSSVNIYYESFDNGVSWSLQNPRSTNTGPSVSAWGEECTFKSNNDDFFMTAMCQDQQLYVFFNRKDNFARLPVHYSNFGVFSRLAFSDQTARYIHCSYDAIQSRFNIAVTYLEGQVEVITSPPFKNSSLKNFDILISDSTSNLLFPPKDQWISKFAVDPYHGLADSGSGKTLIANDRNGDTVMVVSNRFDSTSFVMLRTNNSKDELNKLGGFMKSTDKSTTRLDKYINSMFTDRNGDIIMATATAEESGMYLVQSVAMSIHKYGQLSTVPQELDGDETLIYPQQIASPTNVVYDSTTNGWLFAGTSDGYIGQTGIYFNSVHNTLNYPSGGFKMEWRSFIETMNIMYNNTNKNITINLSGDIAVAGSDTWQISLDIRYRIGHIGVIDNFTGSALGEYALNTNKLRRHFITIAPTIDNKAHVMLFIEDLNVSNYDKIVWIKAIDFVVDQTNRFYANPYDRIVIGGSLPDSLHLQYLTVTRENPQLQSQRNENCSAISENIPLLDFTSTELYRNLAGIPASRIYVDKFQDGLRASWSGMDGVAGDYWRFVPKSHNAPDKLVEKEPFTVFMSVSDATNTNIYFDATSSGLQYLPANTVVLSGCNFRKCFLTGSRYVGETLEQVTKEIYFDIDQGLLTCNALSQGDSCIIESKNKNWRIGEHVGRYVQLEECGIDNTRYRHMAFEIIDSANENLIINTKGISLDSSLGMGFIIYDNKTSLMFDQFEASTWNINVPTNQCNSASFWGDTTCQGAVWLNRHRIIGEFDLGIMTNPLDAVDADVEITQLTDTLVKTTPNMSSVAFEVSRPRVQKKFKYSNASKETLLNIKDMYSALYGSGKTLWVFSDQTSYPRDFGLYRIVNEPIIEEINDEIQSVDIEVEEIT